MRLLNVSSGKSYVDNCSFRPHFRMQNHTNAYLKLIQNNSTAWMRGSPSTEIHTILKTKEKQNTTTNECLIETLNTKMTHFAWTNSSCYLHSKQFAVRRPYTKHVCECWYKVFQNTFSSCLKQRIIRMPG